MSRIFKYELQVESRQLITTPPGSKILSLGVQNEIPVLFVEVNPENAGSEQHVIRTVTTGEVFNAEDCVFIGTVIIKGWYTCHVYEQAVKGAPDPVEDRFLEDRAQVRKELSLTEAVTKVMRNKPWEHSHIGRSWVGHPIEDECPCPQEPCGLIDYMKIDPKCPQHAITAGKTIRQTHWAEECPGASDAV